MGEKRKPATICIQSGWKPKNGEPRVLPIYQSTTFKYETSEQMGRLFDLEEDGYFYTRLANPTNDAVAEKICELEGGVAAMLTSSGQAANYYAAFNICNAGDHIISAATIYGGTSNLFTVTMKKQGIDVTLVDPDAPEEEIEKAFRPNTKMVFILAVINAYISTRITTPIEKLERSVNGQSFSVSAAGAAGFSNIFFARFNCFTTIKITNAMIMKLMISVINRP